MSWRRSRSSMVIRDTSRGQAGYKRDIRALSRQNSFVRSFRGGASSEESPQAEDRGFQESCGLVYKKLKFNRIFRIRVGYSLCLIWIYMFLGWKSGQLGPVLLDLALITGVNLEAASTYIIVIGVGYIIGSCLGGLVYDRVSRPMVLFIVCQILAAMEISIPYCNKYWVMMIVLFFDSVCEGFLDTVVNTEMVYLWGKSAEVCMKSMYFAFICGAIISPLVTAPFLAPEVKWMNATAADGPLNHYDVRESRIWIVYMINAIIAVIATSLFFHQCLVYSRFLHGRTVTTNNDIHVRHLSKKEKIIILLNMGLFFLVYSAIEETFTEYLTVFCVSRMGMTKTQGSQATSIYFAAFGVFRFLGIHLVASMDPIYLVVVYLVILILSFVGLVLTGAFIHVIGIWLFAPLVGIGLSIIYPILYTWTDEQFLPISGKIAAYLVTSASLGRIINAAILGHLMQFVTPVWYCYLLLIEALLFIVLYDVCLLLSRWIASKPDLESLSNSEFELDIIQKNFGLDQRYDPSIGSFDAKSPQPADTTGLQATVRLSSTTTRTKSKQSETGKLDSIYEDKLGTYV